MGDMPAAEPQSERGAMGSRDTGSDAPEGGPVDRPSGTADADDDTSVDPQDSSSIELQTP